MLSPHPPSHQRPGTGDPTAGGASSGTEGTHKRVSFRRSCTLFPIPIFLMGKEDRQCIVFLFRLFPAHHKMLLLQGLGAPGDHVLSPRVHGSINLSEKHCHCLPNRFCVKSKPDTLAIQLLSHVRLFSTPRTAARLLCPSPAPGVCSNSCPLRLGTKGLKRYLFKRLLNPNFKKACTNL